MAVPGYFLLVVLFGELGAVCGRAMCSCSGSNVCGDGVGAGALNPAAPAADLAAMTE